MKVVAAYLLAMLGGNKSPDEDDIKRILSAGGASVDDAKIKLFLSLVDGNDINQLISAGRERLLSFSALPVTGSAQLDVGFPSVESDERQAAWVKDTALEVVLSTLPLKEVVKLKCVPYLKDLISQPSFTNFRSRSSIYRIFHAYEEIDRDTFCILDPHEGPVSVSYPPQFHERMRIAGSARGLILLGECGQHTLLGECGQHTLNDDARGLILLAECSQHTLNDDTSSDWSSISGDSTRLHNFSGERDTDPPFDAIYIFHLIAGLSKKILVPNLDRRTFVADGFGYVKSLGGFVYVRITRAIGTNVDGKNWLEVFDISKGECRIIKKVKECLPRTFQQCSATWLDNAMYWLPYDKCYKDTFGDSDRILRLDLGSYELCFIDPPKIKSIWSHIGVMRHKLCLLNKCDESRSPDSKIINHFQLWERNDDNWNILSEFVIPGLRYSLMYPCLLNDRRILFDGELLYDYSNNSSEGLTNNFYQSVEAIEFDEDFSATSEQMNIMTQKKVQHYGIMQVMFVFDGNELSCPTADYFKKFVESQGHGDKLHISATNYDSLQALPCKARHQFWVGNDIFIAMEDKTKELLKYQFGRWINYEEFAVAPDLDRKMKLLGPPDEESDGEPIGLELHLKNAFDLLLESIFDENTICPILIEGEDDGTTSDAGEDDVNTSDDELSLTEGEADGKSSDDQWEWSHL